MRVPRWPLALLMLPGLARMGILVGCAASTEPAVAAPKLVPAPIPIDALASADVVGSGATALLSEAEAATAASQLPAELKLLAGPKDAILMRGPKLPKGPRKVDVPVNAEAPWLNLLVAVSGKGKLGDVVLRLNFVGAQGGTRTTDLDLGTDVFSYELAGSSMVSAPVAIAPERALGLLRIPNPLGSEALATLQLESRVATLDVAVLAMSIGTAGTPLPDPEPLTPGFTYPITLRSKAPPAPAGWAVPKEAGAQGKVVVRDGHLAFEKGGRARFWGINLLNQACFPTKEHADLLATQLADQGFNLVRLHHCDSDKAGGVVTGRTDPASPRWHAEVVDRMDYLVGALKKQGVYVLLEVNTQRSFTVADGAVGPYNDVAQGHKLLSIFEPTWRKAYLDWTDAWAGRTNPYTGMRYADDPVVAMVELTNEHSLAMNFLTGGIERMPPEHRAKLDVAWNEFLKQRYADDAAINAAWTGSVNPGLRPGETLGRVSRQPFNQGSFGNWPDARAADLYDFYQPYDASFLADVAGRVRKLGYTVPIVGGITYDTPVVAQSLATYDVIDAHIEWDPSVGTTQRNDSAIENPRAQGLTERFRVAQVGKPMMVSELNHFFPNDYGSEAPLLWAALASVQDWDALVWLNYTNGAVVEESGPMQVPTELRRAPVKWVQMPAASGLFRSGAIAPAGGLLAFWRTPELVKAHTLALSRPSGGILRDVRTLLGSRLREAYGRTPPGSAPAAPPPGVGWWPAGSRFVVDTPKLAAVLGDHGLRFRAGTGEGLGPTRSAHLDAELDGAAAVSLTCVDGDLPRCKKGVLIVAGKMENDQMLRWASGTYNHTDTGKVTVVSRPGGRVRFAWPKQPVLRAIAPDGTLGEPIPVVADGSGWWAVPMETAGPALVWQVGA